MTASANAGSVERNDVSRLSFGSAKCVDDHLEVDGIAIRARRQWRKIRVARNQFRLRVDSTISIDGTAREEGRIALTKETESSDVARPKCGFV
jgi:hypothetical protein